MKVASSNATKVEASGSIQTLGEVGIRAQSVAKLFSIVTERLYENPIAAICRELMTNMVDAWMLQDSAKAQPGYVRLPSALDQTIAFVDYGPGLSLDEVRLYVMHILESSKDQSDEFHGGWGLGMKSPFAYTKAWTIRSRQGGLETSYATYMQDTGTPTVSQLGSPQPTDEPDGLTIELPVQQKDTSEFTRWAKWYASYLPADSVQVPGAAPPLYEDGLEGVITLPSGLDVGWRLRQKESPRAPDESTVSHYYGSDQPASLRAILGSVPYCNLKLGDVKDVNLKRIPLDLFFPIGSLQVTPDRDRLMAESLRLVQAALEKVVTQLGEQLLESLRTGLAWDVLISSEEDSLVIPKRSAIQGLMKSDQVEQLQVGGPGGSTLPTVRVGSAGTMVSLVNDGRKTSYRIHTKQLAKRLAEALELKNDGDDSDLGDLWDRLQFRVRYANAASRLDNLGTLKDLDTLHIYDALDCVVVNDHGLGAVSRMVHAPINSPSGVRWNWDKGFQLILHIADSNNRGYLSHPDGSAALREKVAEVFSIPPGKVSLVSKMADPPAKDQASRGQKLKPDNKHWLHDHPNVKVLGFGDVGFDDTREGDGRYYSFHTRDWPFSRDPYTVGGYYVRMSGGSFDGGEIGLPPTTAAKAVEDWDFLKFSEVWSVRKRPVLFAPSNVVDTLVEQSAPEDPGWHCFVSAYKQALLDAVDYVDLDYAAYSISYEIGRKLTAAKHILMSAAALCSEGADGLPSYIRSLYDRVSRWYLLDDPAPEGKPNLRVREMQIIFQKLLPHSPTAAEENLKRDLEYVSQRLFQYKLLKNSRLRDAALTLGEEEKAALLPTLFRRF